MTKEKLYEMYYIQNMSISEIVRTTGISRRRIEKKLKEYDIPKKTMSETINGIKHKICHKRSKEHQDAINEKRRQTNLSKYGVENAFQSDVVKEKYRETMMSKYGVENAFQSDAVKEKYRETMMSTYGVENAFQSDVVKEKIKETNLSKYGVENAFQSDVVKEKYRETMMSKYGVENPGQMADHSKKLQNAWNNKTISERSHTKQLRESTMLENYGVKYLIHDELHYRKMINAMLQKHGVEHGFQSSHLLQKAMESQEHRTRYKDFIFPSGKQVKVMGYEPLFLEYLLTIYEESDIKVGFQNVPIIGYLDADMKERRYYPDIYIPIKNTLYEVKSEYTFICDEKNNLLKHQYACNAGYTHIIVILDDTGVILNEIS